MANRRRWFRHREGDPLPDGPCVYFARTVLSVAGSKIWKAGSTVSVRRRLRELDLGPYRLVSFMPCTSIEAARAEERSLHARFVWPIAGAGREYYRRPC